MLLGLVMLGGAVGVASRAALLLPFGADAAPLVTLMINVVGSLLLGIVVGWLGSGSPRMRALLGTGVLGGFTTYSAFAVQVVILADGDASIALVVAVASVLLGVGAAVIGLLLGRRVARDPITEPGAAE